MYLVCLKEAPPWVASVKHPEHAFQYEIITNVYKYAIYSEINIS